MPTPEVSVVLPVRNAARFLPECIDSIRSQTLPDFEVLAIDDGSADGSGLILREWANSDPRVRLISPGKIGLVASLNLGLEQSVAPLVARMDADDRMSPERLALQLTFLGQNPGIGVAGCLIEMFPEHEVRRGYIEYIRWQNACVSPEEIRNNIFAESPFVHPSVMFRRQIVCSAGGYRQGNYPEDYDLWLRLASYGLAMAKIPLVLYSWRESPGRLSRIDPRYSRAAFNRLRAEFLALDPRVCNGQRELVIWGAGKKTRRRTRLLLHHGITPHAWVDIDPRRVGSSLWSLPIHPPEWLAARIPRPFVLIYVTNHGAREEISHQLQDFGYQPGGDFLPVGM